VKRPGTPPPPRYAPQSMERSIGTSLDSGGSLHALASAGVSFDFRNFGIKHDDQISLVPSALAGPLFLNLNFLEKPVTNFGRWDPNLWRVRFAPKATELLRRRELPLCANRRHMHRSTDRRYSITSSTCARKIGESNSPSACAVLLLTVT
jgi:hypothetical protein